MGFKGLTFASFVYRLRQLLMVEVWGTLTCMYGLDRKLRWLDMGFLESSQRNRGALLSIINYLTSLILLKLFEEAAESFKPLL